MGLLTKQVLPRNVLSLNIRLSEVVHPRKHVFEREGAVLVSNKREGKSHVVVAGKCQDYGVYTTRDDILARDINGCLVLKRTQAYQTLTSRISSRTIITNGYIVQNVRSQALLLTMPFGSMSSALHKWE